MNTYSPERQQAVAVIESLRSGIPTRLSTQALPDLRAYLSEKIEADLQRFAAGEIPPGRLIWGQYGQGKTHMLTTIEHQALEMGFAVSRVTLSREVSCHQLFHFYGRLANALRTPDSLLSGLKQRLSEVKPAALAASPLADPTRYTHPLPRQVAEDCLAAEGEDQELLYGDLCGTRLQVKELRRIHKTCRQAAWPKFPESFKLREHAAAYLEVMADLVQLCGYKGWVLLIDEVELMGRLGRVSRLKAYQNLNWLLNWSAIKAPVYTLGAVASRLQDDTWYGGRGRKVDDRTGMPELAGEREGKHAKAAMAQFFKQAVSKDCPVMRPVHENELSALLEELVRLHGVAHDWPAQLDIADLLHYLGSQPVRTYLRAALEALDLNCLYGQHEAIQAAELLESDLHEDEAFFSSRAESESEVEPEAAVVAEG